MNRSKRYSPEVRERAVRLVFDSQKEDQSQWAAIQSIADKIGCTHETLRRWVRQQEQDRGLRAGLSSDDREALKQLNFNEEYLDEVMERLDEEMEDASHFVEFL